MTGDGTKHRWIALRGWRSATLAQLYRRLVEPSVRPRAKPMTVRFPYPARSSILHTGGDLFISARRHRSPLLTTPFYMNSSVDVSQT